MSKQENHSRDLTTHRNEPVQKPADRQNWTDLSQKNRQIEGVYLQPLGSHDSNPFPRPQSSSPNVIAIDNAPTQEVKPVNNTPPKTAED